jgi:hypothetical protein
MTNQSLHPIIQECIRRAVEMIPHLIDQANQAYTQKLTPRKFASSLSKWSYNRRNEIDPNFWYFQSLGVHDSDTWAVGAAPVHSQGDWRKLWRQFDSQPHIFTGLVFWIECKEDGEFTMLIKYATRNPKGSEAYKLKGLEVHRKNVFEFNYQPKNV